jgi:hypothetical protein
VIELATESVHEPGPSYRPGDPVRIRVRHRGIRYDIDDLGAAVDLTGKPPGWLETARRVVSEHGWNVNRAGVVFVPAVEGRDIDALVNRTAEVSVEVLDALLDLDS